jgi:hypothetical protein
VNADGLLHQGAHPGAPLIAASQPPAPTELRQPLRALDQHVDDCISRARLDKPAQKFDINMKILRNF